MNKVFIYAIVVILVGIAVWFFVQKAKSVVPADQALGLNSETKSKINADDNQTDESGTSLDLSKEGDWIKLDSGLQYKDIVVGTGQESKSGDMIAAHYTGTLKDGTKFDSSYDRGQPFAFLLGAGQVIQGWDIGLVGMKVGGKRKLIIPSELGYGEKGAGGAIPPNSILYFDVELMAVQTPASQ